MFAAVLEADVADATRPWPGAANALAAASSWPIAAPVPQFAAPVADAVVAQVVG